MLNRFPQFKADVNGINIHFIHEIGSGSAPTPLLISHGWPGSIAEFMEIIEPLAHPERFGGNVEDAFTVIAPSLPGFGYSDRPPRPWGPRKMADHPQFTDDRCTRLQPLYRPRRRLGWGYQFMAGSRTRRLPCAIHINILTMRHPDGPQGAEEKAWAERFDQDQVKWKMVIARNRRPDRKL